MKRQNELHLLKAAAKIKVALDALQAFLPLKARAYGDAHNLQPELWRVLLKQYEDPEDAGQLRVPWALALEMPRITRVLDRICRLVSNPERDKLGEDPWFDLAGDCVAGMTTDFRRRPAPEFDARGFTDPETGLPAFGMAKAAEETMEALLRREDPAPREEGRVPRGVMERVVGRGEGTYRPPPDPRPEHHGFTRCANEFPDIGDERSRQPIQEDPREEEAAEREAVVNPEARLCGRSFITRPGCLSPSVQSWCHLMEGHRGPCRDHLGRQEEG